MATATEVDEFSYLVPGWLWKQQPSTVLRRARQAAKRKRKRADGEPQVHVVLVWPQSQEQKAA
jgi:hypothetical protein